MSQFPKLLGKDFGANGGRTFIVKIEERDCTTKTDTVTVVAKFTNYSVTKYDDYTVPVRLILFDLADLCRKKTGESPLNPRSELYIEGRERPILDALDQFDPVEDVIPDGTVLRAKTLSSYNMTEKEIDDLFDDPDW